MARFVVRHAQSKWWIGIINGWPVAVRHDQTDADALRELLADANLTVGDLCFQSDDVRVRFEEEFGRAVA